VVPPVYTANEIGSALAAFRGEIEQVPPMHSAVKHKGQRLYKLAHQGLVVERAPRPVHIHELVLLERGGDWLRLEIHCSKGTYIRTLAEQIGEALGCGASVSALRRIGSGPFDAEHMHTIDELRERAEGGLDRLDEVLLPMDSALNDWPRVCLSDDVAFYLRQGQPVMVPHAPTEGWVKLFKRDRDFIGVGEVLDDGRIAPRRLLRHAQ
jgi:tRNA pseudouridine55 synthase